MSVVHPLNSIESLNRFGSYRQGLTRDIRHNNESVPATRHGHVGKIGSGRSYQGKRELELNTRVTEVYGKHGHERNPMISKAKDRLRISKRKLTKGVGIGLTRREQARRIYIERRDAHDGRLHPDTAAATEAFNRVQLKSSSSKYNVNIRPLLSYKEVNNDDKKCKYGKFRDGGRWRCAQNLNHKRGGSNEVGDRDSDGDGRDGQRMTDAEHEVAYPHLYRNGDSDEEEDNADPGTRHRVRAAAESDEEEDEEEDEDNAEATRKLNRTRLRHKRNANRGSDEEYEDSEEDQGTGGGGMGDMGDMGDGGGYDEKEDDEAKEDEEAYARRIQRAKKERARRKQAVALKQLADYNKNPPRKSTRKK